MSDKQTFDEKHNQQQCYEIRLKGHLNNRWAEWFEGLTITLEEQRRHAFNWSGDRSGCLAWPAQKSA